MKTVKTEIETKVVRKLQHVNAMGLAALKVQCDDFKTRYICHVESFDLHNLKADMEDISSRIIKWLDNIPLIQTDSAAQTRVRLAVGTIIIIACMAKHYPVGIPIHMSRPAITKVFEDDPFTPDSWKMTREKLPVLRRFERFSTSFEWLTVQWKHALLYYYHPAIYVTFWETPEIMDWVVNSMDVSSFLQAHPTLSQLFAFSPEANAGERVGWWVAEICTLISMNRALKSENEKLGRENRDLVRETENIREMYASLCASEETRCEAILKLSLKAIRDRVMKDGLRFFDRDIDDMILSMAVNGSDDGELPSTVETVQSTPADTSPSASSTPTESASVSSSASSGETVQSTPAETSSTTDSLSASASAMTTDPQAFDMTMTKELCDLNKISQTELEKMVTRSALRPLIIAQWVYIKATKYRSYGIDDATAKRADLLYAYHMGKCRGDKKRTKQTFLKAIPEFRNWSSPTTVNMFFDSILELGKLRSKHSCLTPYIHPTRIAGHLLPHRVLGRSCLEYLGHLLVGKQFDIDGGSVVPRPEATDDVANAPRRQQSSSSSSSLTSSLTLSSFTTPRTSWRGDFSDHLKSVDNELRKFTGKSLARLSKDILLSSPERPMIIAQWLFIRSTKFHSRGMFINDIYGRRADLLYEHHVKKCQECVKMTHTTFRTIPEFANWSKKKTQGRFYALLTLGELRAKHPCLTPFCLPPRIVGERLEANHVFTRRCMECLAQLFDNQSGSNSNTRPPPALDAETHDDDDDSDNDNSDDDDSDNDEDDDDNGDEDDDDRRPKRRRTDVSV